MLAVYKRLPVRHFAKLTWNNEHLIDKEMQRQEEQAFNNAVTPQQREIYERDRQLMLQLSHKSQQNAMNWTNKLKDMTEREMKLLPYTFLKKYGSIVHMMRRMEGEAKVRENKSLPMYQQVRHNDKVLRDDEKAALQEFKDLHVLDDTVALKDLIKNNEDYFRRQPRIDPSKLSYNYEQYRRYTKNLTQAKIKDDFESARFYKMLKYVKDNIQTPGDPWVNRFMTQQGNDPTLITIPEEFKNLEVEDGEHLVRFGKPRRGRQYINKKTDTSLHNFDVWRCTDRDLVKGSGKDPAVAKLMIAPADLIKLFGIPDQTEIFYNGTGQYSFEDSNLDTYCLFDYKQTDFYHGLNREDEYYTNTANLKKPLHQRKRKYPTIEQFWTSTEPQEFRLMADSQSEWRKFRRWLKKQLLNIPEKSFEQIANEKYGDEIGISFGEWDKKAVFCYDMAVLNYDWTYHMTAEELKGFKGELPEKFVVPKMFDLSKAERVVQSKEEIKLAELEKEVAQKAQKAKEQAK